MRPIIIAVFIHISVQAFAQPDLVRYEELTFSSPFEKQILDDHFLNAKTDYFLLFMANGAVMTESNVIKARDQFYEHLKALNNEKFNGRKNDKKIKTLYDDFHSSFLRRYELSNRFEDIFHNGTFNSVSGSVLFALAFHELAIPFEVKENDNSIYLVAYPESEKIIVESTSSTGGFITVSREFKEQYAKMLRDQKIISQQEYGSTTANSLYDKYYLGNHENLTFEHLIAIQYINDALFLTSQGKHEEAMVQLEKAYVFMPTERTSYLLLVTSVQAFAAKQAKDEDHAALLGKVSRHKRYGIKHDMIQSDFATAIQEILFDNNDRQKLERYYEVLDSMITDHELKQKIAFQYHYEIGRAQFNKGHFKEALPAFEQTLKINPSNLDASSLFIRSVAQTIRNSTNSDRLTVLENYSKVYPLLLDNNFFNEMLTNTYLIEFQNGYQAGKPLEGEKYRSIFEAFVKDHHDIPFDDFLLGQAYSSAAVFYFRKGQNSKAKSIVAKGLEISPQNNDLRMSLRMID
jgi:tetratricopeptide (TPR) repeat protein